MLLGGQCVGGQALGREVFHGIAFPELPPLLEKVLRTYLARRTRPAGDLRADSPRGTASKNSRKCFPNELMPSTTPPLAPAVPYLPDNAPFTPAQRAWLNGFLAGLYSSAPGAARRLGRAGSAESFAPGALRLRERQLRGARQAARQSRREEAASRRRRSASTRSPRAIWRRSSTC